MPKNAILLAGGLGTRLSPLTQTINKHLLPVNGKFIIDYPLHTLKQMGVENCTVVLGGEHFSQVVDHIQDGRNHGVNVNYRFQGAAKGIAQAINICQRNMDDEDQFVVILGDNIFEQDVIWSNNERSAQIMVKQVPDPNRFGVAFCNALGNIEKIEEKPFVLPSEYNAFAITGCYLFDHWYFDYFKNLMPSNRSEYEITDIIQQYWKDNELIANVYEAKWGDAGTHQSIAEWNNYFYQQGNEN
jgi:glucose-1-phosphate thymidylyltransferase